MEHTHVSVAVMTSRWPGKRAGVSSRLLGSSWEVHIPCLLHWSSCLPWQTRSGVPLAGVWAPPASPQVSCQNQNQLILQRWCLLPLRGLASRHSQTHILSFSAHTTLFSFATHCIWHLCLSVIMVVLIIISPNLISTLKACLLYSSSWGTLKNFQVWNWM